MVRDEPSDGHTNSVFPASAQRPAASERPTLTQYPPIMHRFWEINEMVRLLATILNKQYDASASAVALACCSKRLEDIVLDSVWEKLIGLEHLMRCLPTDTWEIHDDEFVSTTCSSPLALGLTGQQTFLRCPANKEWIRFSSYARRIRVL